MSPGKCHCKTPHTASLPSAKRCISVDPRMPISSLKRPKALSGISGMSRAFVSLAIVSAQTSAGTGCPDAGCRAALTIALARARLRKEQPLHSDSVSESPLIHVGLPVRKSMSYWCALRSFKLKMDVMQNAQRACCCQCHSSATERLRTVRLFVPVVHFMVQLSLQNEAEIILAPRAACSHCGER